MSIRRVAITGLGTVNPLANSVPDFFNRLAKGQSGVAPLTQFDTAAFRTRFGGEVKDFGPDPAVIDARQAKRMDRFTQFAVAAAAEAVNMSGLDFDKEDPFRCGAIVGSGIGGLNEFESQHSEYLDNGPRRISPFTIPKMMPNSAAGTISIRYGLRGVCTAVSTACASAANAVMDAMRTIRLGEADVMVTGGSEAAITPMGLGGFCSSKALSARNDAPEKASRPFDKGRDGFVLSEGAGVLILEEFEHAERRGAVILAELLGGGSTADGYHITAPHPEGLGSSQAMRFALRDAGVNPDEVEYVNAHGTSTEQGDVAETNALKKVFGDHAKRLMVSSTKSMIGHLLGASGGAEAIACVLAVKDGIVHPTINLDDPDSACDLDYVPHEARIAKVRRAISNSFGFGGHNCTLVIGSPE